MQLHKGSTVIREPDSKEINFNYLGYYRIRKSVDTNNAVPIFTFYSQPLRDSIDTFHRNGIDISEGGLVNSFQCESKLKNSSNDLYNNYFTRLLYSSGSNFPDFYLKIGNETDNEIYTVSNSQEANRYYERYKSKKIFRGIFKVDFIDCNYSDRFQNRISPTSTKESETIKKSIGEINYTFEKYGELHPTSKRYVYRNGRHTYEKNTYWKGRNTSIEVETPVKYTSEPVVSYTGEKRNGKNTIRSVGSNDAIHLNFYSLDRNTSFNSTGTLTHTVVADLVPAQELKFIEKFPFEELAFDWIVKAHEECYMSQCDLEDLKKWVQEIHLALEADHFAYLDRSDDTSRVWNLGRKIEAIATVLGLSFNSDNSIRSIRQGKLIKQGDSIPAGWNFGQFGRNEGGSSKGQTGGNSGETRYGIAYEVRSNVFTNDDFSGETNAIEQGGVILCENIPQLLHFVIQDIDRALGMQDMGANVLPTPNGEVANYQGLNQMVLDTLYTLSQLSKQISSINVLSLKSQAMQQEILSGFGLPIGIKEIEITDSSGVIGVLPFPGFDLNAPTLTDMIGLNLLNTGSLIGSQMQVNGNSDTENSDKNE